MLLNCFKNSVDSFVPLAAAAAVAIVIAVALLATTGAAAASFAQMVQS